MLIQSKMTSILIFLFKVDYDGLWAMGLGGFMFLSGVIFFKSDGLIPFAHAIWHCFVFFGASFHYYAVYNYLIIPSSDRRDSMAKPSPPIQ
jgi:monocyte-to-macrophage differentiation protein